MSKLKRPEKIQTSSMAGANGSSSTTTSPSLSAKRPPSAVILPPTSATSSGVGASNGASRTVNRPRRDAPAQLLGRGQRTTSAGLRSGSIVPDTTATQVSQPQPYVQSDEYILRKYSGYPASLIVHLHPTHFRFDQQDGTFSYKSPMRVFIEHLRSRTIPHDLMEYFTQWSTPFYEGCLIIELHDHKSIATKQESSQTTSSSAEKTEPFSIHNYNNYLTPSSWVPYPKENLMTLTKIGIGAEKPNEEGKSVKSASEKDKENMPAPGQPIEAQRNKASSASKQPAIKTVVLHPTPISTHTDLVIKAATPMLIPIRDRRESRTELNGIAPMSASGTRPQTPMVTIPSTPSLGMEPPPSKRAKKERMELDGKNIYSAESQITLATTAELVLDTVDSAEESARLLQNLTHPDHASAVPSPKTRKKTVAEMAAEESAAADEEQYMLILDERYNNGVPGGGNPADADGQVNGTSFEPRFERFKAIESIKLQVIENKKLEKIAQAEAAKKQQQETEAREKIRLENLKRQEEEARQRSLHLQQQQQQLRQQQQQENQRRMNSQSQQNQEGGRMQPIQIPQPPLGQLQGTHAHPAQNMPIQNMANGMNPNQRFLQQQQMSQGQVSSPVVRNATPQNLSSPMVASNIGASMQQSTSSMGGSPPRPGSVVQQTHPQMTPAMAHAMRAQSSQQSSGTPRLPSATPNMPQAVPRQISQTPRTSQASPMPGHMAQVPQMVPQLMPNGQVMNAQMQQAHIIAQQQAQQRMRQQAVQQAMGSSPSNVQQMTPQQFALQQQMQQHQGNPGMMSGNQMAGQYAATMRAMAAQQASGIQPGMQNGMPNPNYMAAINGMNPQMMQQAQQQAQQQQGPSAMQVRARQMANNLYNNGLPALSQQWNGQIPPDVMNQWKVQCQQKAQNTIRQQMMQHQQNSIRQQQMMAQQAGMGQNMNGNINGNMGNMGNMNGMGNMGNMNGMGMQRQPGM